MKSTNERKFRDDLNNFNIKEQFKSLRFVKEIFNTNCLVMKTIGINSSIGNVKYIKIFLYRIFLFCILLVMNEKKRYSN